MIASREARPTVRFIDEYCQLYQSLFSDVRAFESFKHLHVGMLSDIKRKSLPAIAKVVGLENEQSLHHFLEGLNNRIQLIKRQAYGFENFDNFRSRLLAALS